VNSEDRRDVPPNRRVDEETIELIDDALIEAMLDGRPVDARFDHLASFVGQAGGLSDRPPPRPSTNLAALIARGGPPPRLPRSTSPGRRSRLASAAAGVAGLGIAAKLALGAAGVAGVAAAGAAGVLPDQADRPIRRAIEATTPIEFDEPAPSPVPAPPPTTERTTTTTSAPTSQPTQPAAPPPASDDEGDDDDGGDDAPAPLGSTGDDSDDADDGEGQGEGDDGSTGEDD
jgi:hypothetical protein